MAVLAHLEPQRVFDYFEQLCAIPHGSGNTGRLSDWLVDFSISHGLAYRQDPQGNVVIWGSGSAGREKEAPVILQGHMDMVCEKDANCQKDMSREGLELIIDGDMIRAAGTTLGGDDGIAVAMMLALLEADNLSHPPLECVFTVDEEVGMLGAAAIDVSTLKGRRMLNLDSEDENIFTVSCAGGNVTQCILPINRSEFLGTPLKISILGLIGGHSGAEIHKGRGNADLLLGRILWALRQQSDFRIVSVYGGQKGNAIPCCATATVVAKCPETVRQICAQISQILSREYAAVDGGLRLQVEESSMAVPMDCHSTDRVIALLHCAPNGVQTMSPHIPGLVQTSLNLGILTTQDSSVTASFCVRSSVASEKEALVQRLTCLTEMLGGTVSVSGDYPGWEYQPHSPLRELMVDVFTEQYGFAPTIQAIHAGVECGLFAGKLPGLDCISFGPDQKEIHTSREQLSISSVQRVWAFLTEVLRRM